MALKISFRAVGGAPCWRCDGIVYHYTLDDAVAHVDAYCENCNANNMFCPSPPLPVRYDINTPSDVAAAHRAAQAGPRLPSTRCRDCGWVMPRFDCPHAGCNGVALHTKENWPRPPRMASRITKYVIHHSKDWDTLVGQGWVTREVIDHPIIENLRVAIMVRSEQKGATQ